MPINIAKVLIAALAATFAQYAVYGHDVAIARTSDAETRMTAELAKATLKSLASKYNCSLDAASLVETLAKVTAENKATTAKLVQDCEGAQRTYNDSLKTQLAEADALAATAEAEGLKVFRSGRTVANTTYSKIINAQAALVKTASSKYLEARTKSVEAKARFEDAKERRDIAVNVYDAKVQDIDSSVELQVKLLNETLTSTLRSARKQRGTLKANADANKQASLNMCKQTFQKRMAQVNSDEAILEAQVKPLLTKLKSCNPVKSESSKDGGRFLQVNEGRSANTRGAGKKCQAIRRKLQTSLLEIHSKPAEEVTGDVNDWTRRLSEEKVHAGEIRDSCNKEAEDMAANISLALDDTFEKAKSKSEGSHKTSVEELMHESTTRKADAKAIADMTIKPLLEATAAFEVAQADAMEKKAASEAAIESKEYTLNAAKEAFEEAIASGRTDQDTTKKNVLDSAEVLRRNSRHDYVLKTNEMKQSCDDQHLILSEELRLIGQIKEKIGSLTTIRDDIVSAKAEKLEASRLSCEDTCHQGSCIRHGNKYDCICIKGFEGPHCETNINDCEPNPCRHGACIDQVNDYSCDCDDGYEGKNCDVEIDECTDHTCANGATCVDKVGKYECKCKAGFSGDHCEIDIDDCESSPCKNGGTCSDLVNGHSCECKTGWHGSNCEKKVNYCAGSPCKNSGACTSLQATYKCKCTRWYEGKDCAQHKVVAAAKTVGRAFSSFFRL